MAICRWSSNGYMCDLFIYQNNSDEKWYVCVAGRRFIKDDEYPEREDFDEYSEWVTKVTKWADNALVEEIELPYAGETLVIDNIDDTVAKVRELKELGYNIPEDILNKELYLTWS